MLRGILRGCQGGVKGAQRGADRPQAAQRAQRGGGASSSSLRRPPLLDQLSQAAHRPAVRPCPAQPQLTGIVAVRPSPASITSDASGLPSSDASQAAVGQPSADAAQTGLSQS